MTVAVDSSGTTEDAGGAGHFRLKSRYRTCWSSFLVAVLIAGCGTSAPERKAESRVNLSGYSPSFKQGYSDGCESAGRGGQRRDENRFKTEADYTMGWNDGYSVCQRGR